MSLNTVWKNLKNESTTQNVLMTVSDIIKFYIRGRININPEYQRNYRWSNEQKSKFIESILLKYPIPPIIAIQEENADGLPNFEIIDGVQRISSILEFVEEDIPEEKRVKNQNEKLKSLIGADIFKEINGKTWKDFKNENFDFTFEASSILFINFNSPKALIKYDVFERLNTSSTPLSPQEVRNSILALKGKDDFVTISNEIKKISGFIGPANLAKRQDMEFFLEFSLIKHYQEYEEQIEEEIKEYIKISTADKNRHFDLLLTTYSKILDINVFLEDVQDYKEFLKLNEGLDFKKYGEDKNETSGLPIKFFFEILSFLYFKNKEIINKDFYKRYFSKNYHHITKELLKTNNPNARARFELAKKIVQEYTGNELFNI